jgi:response regulator of citrate/malate metabolism
LGFDNLAEKLLRNTDETIDELADGGNTPKKNLPQGISEQQFNQISRLLREKAGHLSSDILIPDINSEGARSARQMNRQAKATCHRHVNKKAIDCW